jgi:tRNA nucleotidyltransferase/poly(A) polymerase
MVLYHLRPAQLTDEPKVTPKAILRFFRETGDDLPAILLLSIADKRATCGPLAPDKEGGNDTDKKVMEFLMTYFKKTEEPMPPPKLVNGNEIMEALNLPPGPLIGRVLKEIEEAQVEKVIKTKEEALTFARRLIEKER